VKYFIWEQSTCLTTSIQAAVAFTGYEDKYCKISALNFVLESPPWEADWVNFGHLGLIQTLELEKNSLAKKPSYYYTLNTQQFREYTWNFYAQCSPLGAFFPIGWNEVGSIYKETNGPISVVDDGHFTIQRNHTWTKKFLIPIENILVVYHTCDDDQMEMETSLEKLWTTGMLQQCSLIPGFQSQE